jgi:hypothetical protein
MNVNAGLVMLDMSCPALVVNLPLLIGDANVIGSGAMFPRVWVDSVLTVEGIGFEVVMNQVSSFF